MIRIAILDAQTIQTLAVAKSLKKLDYYLILICDNKKSYGYHTRFADEKIIAPSIQNDVKEFHNFFMNFLQNQAVDVVIPMNDYSAQYLSMNKDALSKQINFIMPSYDIFLNAYDKNRLMRICSENGFPHPKTVDLSVVRDVERASKEIGFPALIKPNISTGARGISIVNSVSDITKKLSQIIENYGDCHLQEFIQPGGKQYKVELFVSDQKLINSTVIHKIRFYPEKGGSSCYCQTIQNDDLVSVCFDVLKILKWEGFADFDLIEDPTDHIVKIMEINPRIPACIKVSSSSGVNFAENIVQGSLKKPFAKYHYKPGRYLRYLGLDILWLMQSRSRFKSNPSWIKTLFSPRQVLQDGSFDDLLPFIYGTIGGLLKQLNPRFRASKREMT